MKKYAKNSLAGTVAGVVNGLFGGGGGMVLLPLLTRWSGLEQRTIFATCVAVIYPICCAAAVVYLYQVQPKWSLLMPYLLGGIVGGTISGLTFQKVPVCILKLIFGFFLLYGGVRYLL
ncbi:MAG: sulfite exporter TauE/SafE family protein [Oscillospiraceae bacterium]|nr:sulfite exporter TauE/SafE family protein [Oscillospiraceae bacterium]